MQDWTVCKILVVSINLIAIAVAENIQGVNLGGWLLVEEW
jgi:hypothetical protein